MRRQSWRRTFTKRPTWATLFGLTSDVIELALAALAYAGNFEVKCSAWDPPRVKCYCGGTKYDPTWEVRRYGDEELSDYDKGATVFLTVPRGGIAVEVKMLYRGEVAARWLARWNGPSVEFVRLEK